MDAARVCVCSFEAMAQVVGLTAFFRARDVTPPDFVDRQGHRQCGDDTARIALAKQQVTAPLLQLFSQLDKRSEEGAGPMGTFCDRPILRLRQRRTTHPQQWSRCIVRRIQDKQRHDLQQRFGLSSCVGIRLLRIQSIITQP